MKRRYRWLIASHVLAIAIGTAAWRSAPQLQARPEVAARAPEASSNWKEWIKKNLEEVRAETLNHANQIHFEMYASLEDRMQRDRQNRLANERDCLAELAEVREKAKSYENIADPRDAVRRIAPDDYDAPLPIYHAWLRRDRQSALESLSHRGNLLEQNGAQVARLLRDALGNTWTEEALGSEAISYKMRLSIVANAGNQAGLHGGLAKLANLFEKTTDSRLRAAMVESFVYCWLSEDPKETARYLGNGASAELRDLLLYSWREPRALGLSSDKWREVLNEELAGYSLPKYAWKNATTFPHTEGPMWGVRQPPENVPLEQSIKSSEGTPEERVKSVLRWQIKDWIEEGTDLRELYCEKRITRRELVKCLMARISGAEAYPIELERAAWAETLAYSDPDQAAAWGRELLSHGDLSSLIDDARREFSNDPRIELQLERLRVVAALERCAVVCSQDVRGAESPMEGNAPPLPGTRKQRRSVALHGAENTQPHTALDPHEWAERMLKEDSKTKLKEWEAFSPPDAKEWSEGRQRVKADQNVAATWFTQVWERLAEVPLTSIERSMLKSRLVKQWLTLDPGGLMEYLEFKNAWPAPCARYDQSLFDSELPRTRPEKLFQFARRHGYQPVLYGIGKGDAGIWQAMVSALPEPDRGQAWMPNFARLEATPNEERAIERFREGSIAEFTALMAKIVAPESRENISREVACSMEQDRIDQTLVDQLLLLPAGMAESVGQHIFEDLGSTGLSSRAARDVRRALASKLLQSGMGSVASHAIQTITADRWGPPFDRHEAHLENAQWLQTLPEEPALDVIWQAVFQVWTQEDPEAAIASVPKLKRGHARDLAAATVVEQARQYNRDDSDERQQKLRALVEQIGDLKLRKSLEEP